MATNIVDTLQKNLGYPHLHKVDPNIQETKDLPAQSQHERLAQAAIPGVLTALYSLSRSEEGCSKIISRNPESDWLAVIFKGHESEAVAKVAQYSGATENEAEGHMENIADEAIKILREAAGREPKAEKVKTYMNGRVITYLCICLQPCIWVIF